MDNTREIHVPTKRKETFSGKRTKDPQKIALKSVVKCTTRDTTPTLKELSKPFVAASPKT